MSEKSRFIAKGISKNKINEYLAKEFKRAGYSHSEIKRTPMGMNITVYADRVGMVIGRGGETINQITKQLKTEFNLENPSLNVIEINKPFLNATIVSEEIKNAIEKGVNHRKIASIMKKRVMDSGAVGVQIVLAGRFGTAKTRTDKFEEGYMKHAGNYAKTLVSQCTKTAQTKLSTIGVNVKIMLERPGAEIAKLREKMEETPEEVTTTKEGTFTCPHCGAEYGKEKSLKIHIGQKHSEDKKAEAVEEKEQPKKESKEVKEKAKEEAPEKAEETKEASEKTEETSSDDKKEEPKEESE